MKNFYLIFKDLYFSTCDMIKSKDNIVFLDNLLTASETRLEEISDKLKELENEFAKNFKELEGIKLSELPQELSTCLYSHKIAYDNFYDDISIIPVDYYKPGDEEVASKEFVKEKVEEVISFIEAATKDIDKSVAKLMKQVFLQYIVCPFKYNEFEKYIVVCFENIKGTNHEKAAIINIFNLIHFKHLPNMTNLVEYDRYVVHSADEKYEDYNDYLDTYMKKHFHEIGEEDSCECGHEHHHHHHH